MKLPLLSIVALVLTLLAAASSSAATIEMLSGARIECKVLSKDDKTVTIEVTQNGMTVKRTIPLASVHTVTINDKKYVINEKPAPAAAKAGGSAKATARDPADSADGSGAEAKTLRPRAAVEALINELGRQPPEWFEATPLVYPKTLDLSWPEPAPQPWNNQKNVGQYVWDVINPNPGKWREGVKLMHHLLSLHKDDPQKRVKIMDALGRMYHNLHGDYARAAFWWKQAGVDKTNSPPAHSVHLAECYYRLGNKQMALDHLRKLRFIPYDAIKLLADMGQTQEAVRMAERMTGFDGAALDMCYLYAADACRLAGKYPDAIKYYEKVLAVASEDPGKGRIDRSHDRARASIEAIKLFELCDVSKVADGKHKDQSLGYEGPVHVEVQVAGGRIEAVRIVQHKEKQFYSAMRDTPARIIARQGVKGVDATSSATITSEAIINATAKALAGGAK